MHGQSSIFQQLAQSGDGASDAAATIYTDVIIVRHLTQVPAISEQHPGLQSRSYTLASNIGDIYTSALKAGATHKLILYSLKQMVQWLSIVKYLVMSKFIAPLHLLLHLHAIAVATYIRVLHKFELCALHTAKFPVFAGEPCIVMPIANPCFELNPQIAQIHTLCPTYMYRICAVIAWSWRLTYYCELVADMCFHYVA